VRKAVLIKEVRPILVLSLTAFQTGVVGFLPGMEDVYSISGVPEEQLFFFNPKLVRSFDYQKDAIEWQIFRMNFYNFLQKSLMLSAKNLRMSITKLGISERHMKRLSDFLISKGATIQEKTVHVKVSNYYYYHHHPHHNHNQFWIYTFFKFINKD
jgi:hypothetical protein